jgi:phosphate transport system substrate-binding protein
MHNPLRQILRRCAFFAAWSVIATVAADAAGSEVAYRTYEPRPVTIPRDAPYLRPDGTIAVVGDDTMAPALVRLNALFVATHPALRFTMLLKPPPLGMDGVVANVSLFAPVAHDASEAEIEPFKRLTGHRPLDVHIGRLGYAGANRANPPAVYVNDSNPLRRLSLDEVSRIFTTGQMPSDLRRWNQLGVRGDWAKHAIHVYGARDDGAYITALRGEHFGGRPLVGHYEALPGDADILEALAGDRYGIGIAGSVDAARVPKGVRMLALSAAGVAGAASLASYEEVRSGAYPLAPYLHLYVRSAPGESLDPIVSEYIRLALSREGQRIIEGLKARRQGFVPLTPDEAARELSKVNAP